MKRETLEIDIKQAASRLVNLARNLTYNKISDNCFYILTEIKDAETDVLRKRIERKRINNKKIPKDFDDIIIDLKKLFDNLYDVNLYIYKAEKEKTVVEIQYYPKSSLEVDFLRKVNNNDPMLHVKVALPPYIKEKEKFDINWELGGLSTKWKMYWWNKNVKKLINKRNVG